MFYMLATIDRGGFIKRIFAERVGEVVHRESRYTHTVGRTFLGFDSAKAARRDDQLILRVGEDGGVCELWAVPGHIDEVRERLKIWSGCYGAWPVKQLNEGDA